MCARVQFLPILFLYFHLTFGNENLPSCVYEACDRITDPEYITTSCCPEMDMFVEAINDCKGDSSTISTCSQATCVVERYGILTDGRVDFRKVEEVIKELNANNPDQAPLNALGKKYCVQGNYTCFPAEDPSCDNWNWMNCVFFAYRIGCPINDRRGACDDIADDVITCKPYQRRYLRELNRGCTNSCLAPSSRK